MIELDKQGYVNTATSCWFKRQFTLTTRNLQTAAKMNGNWKKVKILEI
jgi:hypothetical protein